MAGDIAEVAPGIVDEVIEATANTVGDELVGESSEEIAKKISINFKSFMMTRIGAIVTSQLEPSTIEAFQATYGTAEDARMTSQQQRTAQGLNEIKSHINEMHYLKKLHQCSKRQNQIIKSQKLIKFIS